MNTASGQGIEISRQRRGEGLTFTRLHFGDLVVIEYHAAHQLDIEMAHAKHPLGSFTHCGKRFWQELIQGFTLFNTSAEFDRLGLQIRIAQRLESRLHGIDLFYNFAQFFQCAIVTAANDTGKQVCNHNQLSGCILLPGKPDKPLYETS